MPQVDQQSASFANVLVGLNHGRFHEEVTEALQKLVKEMNKIADAGGGKPKGKIAVSLELKLDRGIFEIDPVVKVTEPKSVRARTIMYSTADGQLSKTDVRQTALALEAPKVVGFGETVDFKSAQAGDR